METVQSIIDAVPSEVLGSGFSALVGALIGAPIGSWLTRRIDRRRSLRQKIDRLFELHNAWHVYLMRPGESYLEDNPIDPRPTLNSIAHIQKDHGLLRLLADFSIDLDGLLLGEHRHAENPERARAATKRRISERWRDIISHIHKNYRI